MQQPQQQQGQTNIVRSNGGLWYNDKMQSQNSPNMRGAVDITPELLQELCNRYQTLQPGEILQLDLGAWHKVAENTGQQYISLSAKAWVKKPQGAAQGPGYAQPPQQPGYQQPQQGAGQYQQQPPQQQPPPQAQTIPMPAPGYAAGGPSIAPQPGPGYAPEQAAPQGPGPVPQNQGATQGPGPAQQFQDFDDDIPF